MQRLVVAVVIYLRLVPVVFYLFVVGLRCGCVVYGCYGYVGCVVYVGCCCYLFAPVVHVYGLPRLFGCWLVGYAFTFAVVTVVGLIYIYVIYGLRLHGWLLFTF